MLSQQPAQAGVVLHGGVIKSARDRMATCLPAMGFEGCWNSKTAVVGSACGEVAVGTCVESRVHFGRTTDGALDAKWRQPGWNVLRQNVQNISPTEVSMVRVNAGTGENTGCIEESHDYYRLISADEMIVRSFVDVYQDGVYVGRYSTESDLQRKHRGASTLARGETPAE